MTNLKTVFAATLKRRTNTFVQSVLDRLLANGRVVPKPFPDATRWASRAWPLALLTTALALAAWTGCRSNAGEASADDQIAPQNLFMFAALRTPVEQRGVAAQRTDLGRRLYYDPHLSVNGTISCNSCHQLAKYGVDPGRAVSMGYNGKPGGRNSPTVYNSGLEFVQFWDGRAPTLAAQASGPMMNPVEMGMPGPEVVLDYLHANVSYMKQFKAAYPGVKDPVAMDNVTDAIASFEDGLVTPGRWDEYLKGNTTVLSDKEKQGLRVFLNSGCSSCHAGDAMGGNSYAQLGVARNWPDQKSDVGRLAVTKQERDRMTFKVPTLRNVAETGPWFHDGKVQTLDEAVRLMGEYQTGRTLSAEQVSSIVSFLNALTGEIPQQYIQPPVVAAPAAASVGSVGQKRTMERAMSHRAVSIPQRGE